MGYIDEKIVLDFYVDQIKEDNITFLQGRDYFKTEIIKEIGALKAAEEMHDKIEAAKKLWKLLFESAMSFIDPNKEGYDNLFSYFDEYVNFEELIFASDSFYRDHTIHCLWVYFLGEYLYRREEFSFLFKQIHDFENVYRNKRIHIEKYDLTECFKETYETCCRICKRFDLHDSMRCISSLTHDLGYPIKKISKINKSVSKILPYFTIYDFDEFNFGFSEIQKNFIDNFLDILSVDFLYTFEVQTHSHLDYPIDEKVAAQKLLSEHIQMDYENKKFIGYNKTFIDSLNEKDLEILKRATTPRIAVTKNTERYMRYSKDFEEWQHGIMSAFLLAKSVRAFSSTKFYRDYERFANPHIVDFNGLHTKLEILNAVSDHTSVGYKISAIKSTSELLTLVDELEEFSRISRANQNRQFISEFCKTELYSEGSTLNINFIFDNVNIPNLDPEKAFKGRCTRLLTLFDIPNLDENLNIVLRCIGKLPYDDNVYTLEIGRRHANILINGEEQNIPRYLKSSQFYTKEEYAAIGD